jgi:hypothetical protein
MQGLLCVNHLVWGEARQQYNCEEMLSEIDPAHCQ